MLYIYKHEHTCTEVVKEYPTAIIKKWSNYLVTIEGCRDNNRGMYGWHTSPHKICYNWVNNVGVYVTAWFHHAHICTIIVNMHFVLVPTKISAI